MWEKTEEQAYKKKQNQDGKAIRGFFSPREEEEKKKQKKEKDREKEEEEEKKEVGKNFLNNNVHRCYSSRKNEKRKTIASTRKFSY